jgi:undecaprenyl-diphosphatase
MDNTQVIFLSIVQGFTEFLPISSSAHLILLPLVLKWPDQGLVFDVAVHLGSLIAVLVYFRSELVAMTIAWSRNIAGAGSSENSRLAWWVILGTLPAVVVGYLFKGMHCRNRVALCLGDSDCDDRFCATVMVCRFKEIEVAQ